MKIISWNFKGLDSRDKHRVMKEMLKRENLDIIIIQETKKEVVDRRILGGVWGVRYKEWVALPSTGHYSRSMGH